MKLTFIILFFLSVCSCTTQRKVEKYLNNNKEFAADYCSKIFKVNTDTIRLYETDTLRLNYYTNSIDTLIIDTSGTKEKIITITKEKIKEIIKRTPPITLTKIVERENTARVELLTIEKNKLIKENNSLKKYRNISLLIALIIVSSLLIYTYIKYKIK